MTGPVDIERNRSEEGLTIIEVVVASLVLALAAMATFGVLTAATKNAQRAEANQVALNKAQSELEALRSLEDGQLALTAAPPHSSSELSPNYRVSGGTFATVRQPVGSYANLVVNGGSEYGGGVIEGGIVSPGPTSFTSGDVKGKVYRYIVWRDDSTCPAATCPGTQDYKQIVVAVKIDRATNQAGERGYVEVASNFVDPTDNYLNDPVAGANGVLSGQQFYLSDTPCSASGTTVREDIAGNHKLHNTLGTCASGMQNETTLGAPDTLVLGVPPDPDPVDESNPLLYDYSDDFYLEPNPDTDKGVQILKGDTGCVYTPTEEPHREARTHRWVTDPMKSDFKMVENATLEFHTRTLNDESYNGKLCIFLFKRHEVGGVATDTLLTNKADGKTYWSYNPGGTGWWRGKWERVRKAMTFNGPYTIPAGDRLGIALTVDRSETTGDALAIMYDHPKYPSRIEVDTNTPLDGG